MSSYRFGDLLPLVQTEAEKQGVDPSLAIAIFAAENSADGNPDPSRPVSLMTQSPKGALGVMQVLPETLAGLKRNGLVPADLDYSSLTGQITAGVAAIRDIAGRAGNDPFAVAAGYNGGNASLNAYKAGGALNTETTGYLQKVAGKLGLSWSGKILPPTVKAGIEGSLADWAATMARNIPMLQALGISNTAAIEEGKSATTEAGKANAVAIAASAQRETGAVNRDTLLLNQWGIDATKEESEYITQNAIVAEKQHQMDAMRPTLDSLMAISPLNNPVEWIKAQVGLMQMVPQFNNTVKARDSAVAAIATRQALVKQQQTLQPAVTVQTIEQETRAKLDFNAAETRAKLAKFDMENYTARAKVLHEELSWAGTSANLAMSNARLFMEHLGISKDEKATNEQQKTIDNINQSLGALGMEPIPTWSQLAVMPAGRREMLLTVAAGGPSSTPGKAISAIMDLETLPNLRRRSPAVAELASQIIDSVSRDYDKESRKPENAKMSKGDLVNKLVSVKYSQWRDELNFDKPTGKEGYDLLSPGNPYRMNPKIYAGAFAADTKNEIAKYVQGPGSLLPQLGEKEILSFALGQVQAGRKTEAVTRDLYEFFTRGYEQQFKSSGMGTLGFDKDNPKLKTPSYPVSRQIFGGSIRFGGMLTLDHPIQMMNESSVNNFLTGEVAKILSRGWDPTYLRELGAKQQQNEGQ